MIEHGGQTGWHSWLSASGAARWISKNLGKHRKGRHRSAGRVFLKSIRMPGIKFCRTRPRFKEEDIVEVALRTATAKGGNGTIGGFVKLNKERTS